MKRLIIVENDISALADVTYVLSRRGYAVVGQAQHMTEAFRLITRGTFDCAIVTMQLFGRDVLPVIEHLRTVRAPFVLMTGTPSRIKSPQLLELPYLVRPFADEELITAIEQAVQNHNVA